MLSPSEQATLNLETARELRAAGLSYRQIARKIGLTTGQLATVRRALKREKGAQTRLRATPNATDRDLTIGRSVLPLGLRQRLKAAGLVTLGDVADRLADPDFPGLQTMAGIGPHRAERIRRLLDHYGLLPGSDDMQAEIEKLFPELRDGDSDR
jgi:transposase-like protein